MRRGFTLIELLIVIAIIGLLLVFVIINLQGQIAKANDAKRKNDLFTLHNAIEEYNTDHGLFPPQNTVTNCGSAGLAPYIKAVPCDPSTGKAYGYFISPSTGGYRVCAILQDTTDPAIAAIGCSGAAGCGVIGGYNYCLAQGVTPSAVKTSDYLNAGGYLTPTPQVIGGWACGPLDNSGNSYCRFYENAQAFGCPTTFYDYPCNNECQGNPSVRCQK